jgi:tripartite-type tricarboxylate transporter receptor subunit TctC
LVINNATPLHLSIFAIGSILCTPAGRSDRSSPLTLHRDAKRSMKSCPDASTTEGFASSRRSVLAWFGATAALNGSLGAAFAQDASSRIARIIVPFAPGAAVDVVARMLAGPLSAQWGKTVIVENRPGGRTLLAAEAVARSEPDGDTLLFCLDDTFTIVPHLLKPGSFDPTKELVPVNLAGMLLHVIVVNPSLPVDSLEAFIAYARNHPGVINYSSSGAGSALHLAMEMLRSQARIDIVHVPYRGLAPAMTAVVAGEVQAAVLGFGTARSMIESGRLRAIAVASPDRVTALPNVPTTRELGYDRVEATSRLTLAAPARMSAEGIVRINDAVARALDSGEVRKQFEARDIVLTNLGPKPLAEIERISRANGEAVRISGVQAE